MNKKSFGRGDPNGVQEIDSCQDVDLLYCLGRFASEARKWVKADAAAEAPLGVY